MSTVLRIPKAAVSMQEGTLTTWLVPNGSTVVEGQPIYTLELEKSTMDVESPAAGVLMHVGVAGTTYKVGEVIGAIGPAAVASPVANVLAPGPMYHTGFVVRDIHAAVRHWVDVVGVGPFTVFENFAFVDPSYRGAPIGPRVTLAFGARGDTCVELIQPLDDTPSIYTEQPGALHHVGLLVPDLDGGIRRYAEAGIECAFRAAFPFGGGCAYLDTRSTLGVFTELVEGGAVVEGMLAGMRDAHARWNRRDYTFTLG
jgi:hypothetical protein